MRGRTVVLVSHHVQICASGASYIVALDNGRVQFHGNINDFQASGVMDGLIRSEQADGSDDEEEATLVTIEDVMPDIISESEPNSVISSTSASTVASVGKLGQKKAPRKLIEEENRAVGRISTEIWSTYFGACGGRKYWFVFFVIFILAAISPVAENGWLKWVITHYSDVTHC